MPPEGLTIDSPMAHPVMERTIVTRSGTLWVRCEWFRTSHSRLVLDGAKDLVDGELERSEIDICAVSLRVG